MGVRNQVFLLHRYALRQRIFALTIKGIEHLDKTSWFYLLVFKNDQHAIVFEASNDAAVAIQMWGAFQTLKNQTTTNFHGSVQEVVPFVVFCTLEFFGFLFFDMCRA